MDEETTASWREDEWEEEYSTAPGPAPMPVSAPMEAPWPAPAPSSSTSTTAYENVYCRETEGKLEVSDEGLLFSPYVSSRVPANNATPHDIPWKDSTYRELFLDEVKAGYKTYSTMVTFYNLKVGILPSKEAVFSLRRRDEYDRLQCDLDARGYGAPPPPEGNEEFGAEAVGGDLNPDDYDHIADEEVQWEDEQDEDDDVNEQEAAEQQARNMRQSSTTERSEEDNYYGQGWSTQDDTAVPDSSYYPVRCKNKIGSIVLTSKHLQFVPDSHAAPVKTLPWTSLVGRPFFSPWNYPRYVRRFPNNQLCVFPGF